MEAVYLFYFFLRQETKKRQCLVSVHVSVCVEHYTKKTCRIALKEFLQLSKESRRVLGQELKRAQERGEQRESLNESSIVSPSQSPSKSLGKSSRESSRESLRKGLREMEERSQERA